MMQSSSVQTSASSLLSQLFGGMLDDGASLESLDGASFMSALSGQIKELLVQSGEDPAEIASLDGQALVAQFFMMMQGQSTPTDVGLGIGQTQTTQSLGSATTGQSDAMSVLRQFLLSTKSPGTSASEDVALPDGGADAGQASFLKAVPSDLLAQLMESTPIDELATLGPTAGLAATGEGAETSLLDEIQSAMLQQFTREGDDGPIATFGAAMSESFVESDATTLDQATGQGAADHLSDTPGLTLLGMSHLGSSASESAGGAKRAQALDLSMVLQPGGETRLADEVRWIMDGSDGAAEIKLHPPSLGALDVRISMEADKANVQFISPHPIVREVLEAALPRLRESLAQEGLSLGNVTVSDQAPEGRRDTGQDQGQTSQYRQEIDIDGMGSREESGLLDSTLSVLARRHDYFA
jgi:flagellar hook-length control protein FliK